MKTIFTLVTGCVFFATVAFAQVTPETITGRLTRVADPHHPVPGWKDVKVRDEKGIIRWNRDKVENDEYEPPVLFKVKKQAEIFKPAVLSDQAVVSSGNFPGMGFTGVCPADASLAVGDSLIVQMINGGSGAYFAVYRKTSTSAKIDTVVANTYLDAITGKGGLGDPVVLYDQNTKNFILTEFANKNEAGSDGLIIAVFEESKIKTANYIKSYFFPTSVFPDYPKFGINNGYLYAKTNDFRGNSYTGASAYVVNLAALYSQSPSVSMTRFSLGKSNKYYSMCPVNMAGKAKPKFSQGGLFAYLNPASWSGRSTDQIGFVEINPLTQTLTDLNSIPVSSYSFPASQATQPDGGENIDALIYRVMNQPVARTFSDSQRIVVSFTVQNNNSKQSFRWVQFSIANSDTSSSVKFKVSKQNTYVPSDNVSARFQPSVNIDKSGNIGIIYNITNSSSGNKIYPSLYAVGVNSSSSTSYTPEVKIADGKIVSACVNRYGDYNHLVIDPVDSLTFWATGMYNVTSNKRWSTGIGSFTIGASSITVKSTSKPFSPITDIVKENEFAELVQSLYPNPATDFLNLSLKSTETPTRIQLLNINGEVLQEVPVTGTPVRLNTKTLSPGAYYLRILQKEKAVYQKFIKQ